MRSFIMKARYKSTVARSTSIARRSAMLDEKAAVPRFSRVKPTWDERSPERVAWTIRWTTKSGYLRMGDVKCKYAGDASPKWPTLSTEYVACFIERKRSELR